MKKLIGLIVLVVAMTFFSFNTPALADGAATFSNKCAACHIGGKNIMKPTATLSMADLEKNGKNTLEKIVTQVTNGQAPMPAFKGVLTDAQIQEVSQYVLDKAEAGW
jgi:cytochrome c6